jgi:hypothetical protein
MVIEGAMLAANHYTNAALHVLGIRREDSDIIHTDYMTVAQYRRLEILAGGLLAGLESIEDLRAPFVRGSASGGAAAARKARKSLDAVIAAFGCLKPTDLPMADYLPSKAP